MGLYRSLVWLPAAVGLLIGGALWLEHLLWRNSYHSVIRYILTAVLLSLGAVLLSLPDLQSVWSYVRIMVGTGSLAPTEADADVLRAYGLIFLAAVYSVSGNWRYLLRRAEEQSWFRLLRTPLTLLAARVFHLPFLGVVITAYLGEDIPKSLLCLWHFVSMRWLKPVTEEGREGLRLYRGEED